MLLFFLTVANQNGSVGIENTSAHSRDWENDEPPTVGEDQVQDHQRNLNMHKSMGPVEICPWVQMELVDEVANPLSVIFEKSW